MGLGKRGKGRGGKGEEEEEKKGGKKKRYLCRFAGGEANEARINEGVPADRSNNGGD